MINLANHSKATEIITNELTRCGIEVVSSTEPIGEPKSLVYGKLEGFKFIRAWYYYIVEGYVPKYVNDLMYGTVVGKTDIRSGGDCSCRNIWEQYYKDGKEVCVINDKEREALLKYSPNFFTDNIVVDSTKEMTKIGKPYINLYHIDSELGLYIFVQTMKSLNIRGYLE